MSKNFGIQRLVNKNIRNNITIKTEQNSSQAHHIKHQKQNLEDKHCRFRWGNSWAVKSGSAEFAESAIVLFSA